MKTIKFWLTVVLGCLGAFFAMRTASKYRKKSRQMFDGIEADLLNGLDDTLDSTQTRIEEAVQHRDKAEAVEKQTYEKIERIKDKDPDAGELVADWNNSRMHKST